jgi:hypothetical protein
MHDMNGFIRGALGLALAATAGLAIAQPHDPPLAGGPPEGRMVLADGSGPMHDPRFRDDMPGPDRQAGPRRPHADPMPRQGPYDAYGYDRMGLTADGYDRHGYDAHGYDRYGFDPDGYSRDGYDRYGYDENGLDRYGRRAPARRAEAAPDGRPYVEPRDYGDRGYDRYGPPPGYDPEAWPAGRYQSEGYGESYDHESYRERGYGDDRRYGDDRGYGEDRYGPVRDGRYAYDPEVPSYGGAMQHFADPRCDTCRPAPVRYDCGCRGGYQTGSLSLSPTFFYDNGGVGPIPDGGGYGGGGYVVMGGAGASASSSAYASSSSRVSVSVRGGGGHHGGGHGGCNSCGGHK